MASTRATASCTLMPCFERASVSSCRPSIAFTRARSSCACTSSVAIMPACAGGMSSAAARPKARTIQKSTSSCLRRWTMCSLLLVWTTIANRAGKFCPRAPERRHRIATLRRSMRAFFLDPASFNLELREAPVPKPGPGQLLVRVRAAGLNRGEFLRHGLTKPGAPKIGGTEGAGEVEGTGARVMGRLPASFAEYALMDAADAIPVPPNLSWEEAAATPLTFLVVYDMLVQQGNLKKGEWLLVTAASSGVGVAALLAAKALGAKVIGTSGSEEKLKKLSTLGLDVAIQTRKPDFANKVLEVTGNKGADLVVNNVGG